VRVAAKTIKPRLLCHKAYKYAKRRPTVDEWRKMSRETAQ